VDFDLMIADLNKMASNIEKWQLLQLCVNYFKLDSMNVWFWAIDSDKVIELDFGFYEWLADRLNKNPIC
jgi:hypothetical protein